ncbi:hypothetical protein AB0J01_27700 [Streptomyces sp. NPDC050204]|uniref:hypothetical protein n=1 Tax=Streptomyces sp. NPDC050204 TaxID=3155514 RepID=UPI003441DCFB
MAAIAPERPLITLPPERRLADLSDDQRDMHWALMELLGFEGGEATKDGGLDDKAERLEVAQEAARNAWITLPADAEIAECNTCGLVFNADLAYETKGLTFCEKHVDDWTRGNDKADTTFESRRN